MSKIIKPLFFDHDGSFDDLVALIALTGYNHFRLTGVSVTDGAGKIDLSTDLSLRILQFFLDYPVLVAKSSVSATHSFPQLWRDQTRRFLSFPCMSDHLPDLNRLSPLDGPDFLAQTLMNEKEKTVVLVTGPASNLITALEKYPGLDQKIDQVVWMAGAFKCDGNVIAPDHDGSAEWNIFWDPVSAQKLIKRGLNLTMVPIDVCHSVPADRYFMFQLEQCNDSKRCHLASQILKWACHSYQELFVFDLVAAACLGQPDMATIGHAKIDIEVRGTSTGNIYPSDSGANVKYVSQIDEELFYEFVVESLN